MSCWRTQDFVSDGIQVWVDALLGASGLGDIGEHFPDSDPRWRDVESRQFVSATLEMMTRRSLRVVNVDLTLLAQQPRLAPWRDQIRHSVASLLSVPIADVNLKATSTEHLGFLGRNEGLAAMATVLIDRL